MDIDTLRQWIGRTESSEDEITAFPVHALGATLDLDLPPVARGDAVRPLWHWLYFLQSAPHAALGRMVTPSVAGFFRPYRCRAACGLAAGSSFINRCVWVRSPCGIRGSWT